MSNYDVVTEALIDADVTMVFPVFLDASSYSEWKMPYMEETIRGDKQVLQRGSVLDFKINRFGTPTYTGRITSIVPYESINIEFFGGDFVGTGEYSFEPVDGKTRIKFRWNVKPNKFRVTILSRFVDFPELQSEVMRLCFEGLNDFLSPI